MCEIVETCTKKNQFHVYIAGRELWSNITGRTPGSDRKCEVPKFTDKPVSLQNGRSILACSAHLARAVRQMDELRYLKLERYGDFSAAGSITTVAKLI